MAQRTLPTDLAERADVKAITDVELVASTTTPTSCDLGPIDCPGQRSCADHRADRTDWRMMSGAFRLEADGGCPVAAAACQYRRTAAPLRARQKCKAGATDSARGDEGDRYYLIESGRCEVTPRRRADVPPAELKASEAFGEEALVAGSKRNATVTMRTNGVRCASGCGISTNSWSPCSPGRREVGAGCHGRDWLDVRFPAEFQHDRLPGAINIPLNEIRNAIGPRYRQGICCLLPERPGAVPQRPSFSRSMAIGPVA